MTRVLVTGATGHVGSAVAAAFARAGHETFGLVRDGAKARPGRAQDLARQMTCFRKRPHGERAYSVSPHDAARLPYGAQIRDAAQRRQGRHRENGWRTVFSQPSGRCVEGPPVQELAAEIQRLARPSETLRLPLPTGRPVGVTNAQHRHVEILVRRLTRSIQPPVARICGTVPEYHVRSGRLASVVVGLGVRVGVGSGVRKLYTGVGWLRSSIVSSPQGSPAIKLSMVRARLWVELIFKAISICSGSAK